MKPTCLLLIAAFVAFPPAGDDAVKAAKDKLKGTWLATEVTKGGQKSDAKIRIEFDGDKVKASVGDEEGLVGTYAIDPTKSPTTLDVTIEHDGNKVTIAALYELKGDDLRICHALALDGPRPAAIESTADTSLAVLKRQK